MNRAEVIMRLLAHQAAAKALRGMLDADARAEYDEQGTAPTWRLPFATVPVSIEQDGVEVVDEAALMRYLAARHPDEVRTVQVVRNPEWLGRILDAAAQRGIEAAEDAQSEAGPDAPPTEIQVVDSDGVVIPGVKFRPGGAYKSVGVRPTDSAARQLRRMAELYARGEGPLQIEGLRIDG